MTKVFVDTNILVDLIADRKPFSRFAIDIFLKAERGKLKLFTSSHSVATAYYLLKNYSDEKTLRSVISGLLEYLQITAIDREVLQKALKSKHRDFEDAVQIYCASHLAHAEFIVTRNIRDFRDSEVPAYTPDEFLLKY